MQWMRYCSTIVFEWVQKTKLWNKASKKGPSHAVLRFSDKVAMVLIAATMEADPVYCSIECAGYEGTKNKIMEQRGEM